MGEGAEYSLPHALPRTACPSINLLLAGDPLGFNAETALVTLEHLRGVIEGGNGAGTQGHLCLLEAIMLRWFIQPVESAVHGFLPSLIHRLALAVFHLRSPSFVDGPIGTELIGIPKQADS
jgi:hypothetical protein